MARTEESKERAHSEEGSEDGVDAHTRDGGHLGRQKALVWYGDTEVAFYAWIERKRTAMPAMRRTPKEMACPIGGGPPIIEARRNGLPPPTL